LLWEKAVDIDGNEYKVMDRVYSIYDHEIDKFRKWASDNGYIFKYEQSAKRERAFITPSGARNIDLKVELDRLSFENYPYIDTFKFLNKRGFLSNSENFEYHFISNQGDGSLHQHEPTEE
jgi:hypothetical protein